MVLWIAEWEVEINNLEKVIIYIKTDDITMKRDQLKKNNTVLIQKLTDLVDFHFKKTAKYDQLFAWYINLQKEHIDLRQWYNDLQHAQKYQFCKDNDDDDINLFESVKMQLRI